MITECSNLCGYGILHVACIGVVEILDVHNLSGGLVGRGDGIGDGEIGLVVRPAVREIDADVGKVCNIGGLKREAENWNELVSCISEGRKLH